MVGKDGGDYAPKALAVVVLLYMGKLMHDDVIYYPGRREDQPP